MVDWLRSCYTTKIRLNASDPREYRIRWYFAPPGAKPLGFHTKFASGNYSADNTDFPPIGEVQGLGNPWSNGAPPSNRYKGVAPCGPQEWWENGVPVEHLDDNPQRDANGFPVCCHQAIGGFFYAGSNQPGGVVDGINVARQDGSQVVTGVFTLLVGPTEAWGITAMLPGVALVVLQPASEMNDGLLSKSAQTIGGTKHFTENPFVTGDTPGWKVAETLDNAVSGLFGVHAPSSSEGREAFIQYLRPGNNFNFLAHMTDLPSNVPAFILSARQISGGTQFTPRFCLVKSDGTLVQGATGSFLDQDGNTVTVVGGIIVDLGV